MICVWCLKKSDRFLKTRGGEFVCLECVKLLEDDCDE